MDLLNGKITGVITERGRSFSSWIRFRERGLSLLLEGVEACCQGGFEGFQQLLA